MKLTVTENLTYVFDIDPKDEAEVRADPDAWFCNLKKPWEQATEFSVDERDCSIDL